MKIKKTALLILLPVLLIAGVAIFGLYYYNLLLQTWNNQDTWTTKERVVVPKVAEDLKVTYSKKKESDRRETFTFSAEYCYLYKSEYSEDNTSVTLSCSMLPMYYAERQTEVPKDWVEQPDLFVQLQKDDPLPSNYLSRRDTDFTTLYHVDQPLPVSVSITGTYIYPEQNLTTMLLHYQMVKKGEKEELPVDFADLTFTRLDNPTPEFMAERAKTWRADLQKEIDAYVGTQKLNEKAEIEYLNTAKVLFAPERLRCQNLESCDLEYVRNAAEKFTYYVYGQKYGNVGNFERALNAMQSSMYPYNGKPRGTGVGEACPTCGPNWVELSAYSFPICPIKEILSGTRNENTELFLKYAENFVSGFVPLPKTSTAALELMKNYNTDTLFTEGFYDRPIVDGVNMGCYFLLKNGTANNKAVLDRTTALYYEMLSTLIGAPVSKDPSTINKIIYESVAYSPYKSSFIKDYQVLEYREQGVEESNKAAAAYTEWRSILHTYILFYLSYEN